MDVFDSIPRKHIAFLPTPLQHTPRLAERLGLKTLFIKRDDNTGLALGGNKVRKLEFLIADALQKGADIVLTVGGPQSNHCRMTAAAARASGLDAYLIFNGPPVEEVQGNLVLDKLVGAQWTFTRPGQSREERMNEVACELRKQGRKPYLIPLGGSNPIGALGYVNAGIELAEQCREQGIKPRYIICANGSAGTQAGLTLGCFLAGLNAQIIGISVADSAENLVPRTRELIRATGELLHVGCPDAEPVVLDKYVGQGYGIPTKLSQQALKLVAESEGIILDPVYTAKAFAGLIDLVQQGTIKPDDTVIFIHTGGMPALFAEQSLYWGRTY